MAWESRCCLVELCQFIVQSYKGSYFSIPLAIFLKRLALVSFCYMYRTLDICFFHCVSEGDSLHWLQQVLMASCSSVLAAPSLSASAPSSRRRASTVVCIQGGRHGRVASCGVRCSAGGQGGVKVPAKRNLSLTLNL